MTPQHHLPADIERTSISIITRELDELGLTPPPETAAVVKRVIHTTADFDYAKNLRFTPGAVEAAVKALHAGAFIVTDTNMALAGITKPGLKKLNGEAICYMADPAVAIVCVVLLVVAVSCYRIQRVLDGATGCISCQCSQRTGCDET